MTIDQPPHQPDPQARPKSAIHSGNRPPTDKPQGTSLVAVLKALHASQDQPLTAGELMGLVGTTRSAMSYLLGKLQALGLVEEAGKRAVDAGREPLIYRLTELGASLAPDFTSIPKPARPGRHTRDRPATFRAVLAFMYSNPTTPRTAREVAGHIGYTRATSDYALHRLIELGLVTFVGKIPASRGPGQNTYQLTEEGLNHGPAFENLESPARTTTVRHTHPAQRAAVIRALSALATPGTVLELAEASGVPGGTVRRLIDSWLDQGLVVEYDADLSDSAVSSTARYLLSRRGRQQLLPPSGDNSG